MTRLIILGQWGFASALAKTVEGILGSQSGLYPLDFVEGDTADSFVRELSLLTGNSPGEILILSDSPDSLITELALKAGAGRIITGLNLPMLTAVCRLRGQGGDPEALTQAALRSGQEGILLL